MQQGKFSVSDAFVPTVTDREVPLQSGPVELDLAVLDSVVGAGPHGSWGGTGTSSIVSPSGPHGQW